jgi:Flp pilus assembly pilin Flp
MKQGTPFLLRLFQDQRGQGMTEYVVLVVALFIGLIPVLGALQQAFERYYGFFSTWISLPIP